MLIHKDILSVSPSLAPSLLTLWQQCPDLDTAASSHCPSFSQGPLSIQLLRSQRQMEHSEKCSYENRMMTSQPKCPLNLPKLIRPPSPIQMILNCIVLVKDYTLF